jgi:transposase
MQYSGIDLHSTNSVVGVIDEADRVLYCKRLPNDRERILAALAPHREELAGVVVESTYNWYWLVDALMDAGFEVKLANTAAIKRYEGLKHSGDEHDAIYLAHLFRLGLLRTGYIYPRPERALRDLARKRLQLVRMRTQNILSMQSLLARHTAGRPSSDVVKRWARAGIDHAIAALPLEDEVKRALKPNLVVVGTLTDQIEQIEDRVESQLTLREPFAILKSAPGIGKTLAATIMLETGTLERFGSVGQFSSYCRCVDSQRLSNGKKKGEGNTKCGNKYLAWAFIEAAQHAKIHCPEAKRFFDKKRAATNPPIAFKALAHKLARACYHMMRERKAFEVSRCFA